jgi:pseudouridine kinase
MDEHPKVTVIGASNVDITGFTKHELIYKDANIGTMKTSAGGVGRNIAENLSKLDFDVNLVSIFGDDPLSDFIVNHNIDVGINVSESLFLKNASTSTFIAIMDSHNDLALGISAMDIYDNIDTEKLLSKQQKKQADYVVLETNFDEKTLQSAVKLFPDSKIVLDTVSGKKAMRALPVLAHLFILKTNLLEAEMMSGLHAKSPEDYPKLVQWFLDNGVKNVFITLGKEGVIYGNAVKIAHQSSIPSTVINTIGAGDSFVSGLIYADNLDKDIDQCARYGMAAASITVGHNEAVSPDMSVINIERKIEA